MEDSESGIVGTWQLVSATNKSAERGVEQAYGPDPAGLVTYTADSRMSVIITHAGREPLSVNDRVGAPETERAEAFATVISYSGRYTLGEGQVTHHVEVSSVPNWVDTDFVRKATIEGDRLTLRTTPVVHGGVEVVAELVWQRVK